MNNIELQNLISSAVFRNTLWARHNSLFLIIYNATYVPDCSPAKLEFKMYLTKGTHPVNRTSPGEVNLVDKQTRLHRIEWNEIIYIPTDSASTSLRLVLEEYRITNTAQKSDYGIANAVVDIEEELEECVASPSDVRYNRRRLKLEPWKVKDSAAVEKRIGEMEIAFVVFGNPLAGEKDTPRHRVAADRSSRRRRVDRPANVGSGVP